ncbi:glutamyl-tRNA amidotransferase [Methylococcaceae bacterium CS1]|uniref:GatB/YqeY domain-containing protein n=1 Tax=Bathymodiolus platifrons methanotrophic gill symbiont TaxID=113268 RepID=UPI000B42008D|nr:GatB/YqeY domain-containing protein [Bathymodiolus platifrons methanotrophic gill symbiont]TXK98050.1 glutamyl-tRNA amidotransferase [Methylococcaceae bacterium CS5]TXK99053.1 glutamyl-tRNA amidotransferase [Methylococcaceae bacterium CS4]TXL08537.1 glutamyl-tRNA amidotransferase [Methylococcaceae bacterium CS3]TXL09153.1 glutamyl-tRNA amidotransferase [Methylococcaceae bacterium CS1]TXL11336.1 glutamyl-tRNA amidotransferase [Methylococcaceae bacterium CS2]
MTTMRDRLKDEMKLAMKAREKVRLGAIRLMLAAIKQKEVDERIVLDDQQVIAVLDKMLKQRRESIKQYRDASREDLAEVEEAEVLVIQDFLPQALTEEEINDMVMSAIADCSASSIKDMGKVMAALKPAMQGRADMAVVSTQIKAMLAA